MILGFKPQFVEPINSGSKIHTIREDKHDRWKADRFIHFATGVRTKEYYCFGQGVCKGTQRIEIKYFYYGNNVNVTVHIDGRNLHESEVLKLAKNDGFDSIIDFFKWFNRDFTGKIIHWTDKKY